MNKNLDYLQEKCKESRKSTQQNQDQKLGNNKAGTPLIDISNDSLTSFGYFTNP